MDLTAPLLYAFTSIPFFNRYQPPRELQLALSGAGNCLNCYGDIPSWLQISVKLAFSPQSIAVVWHSSALGLCFAVVWHSSALGLCFAVVWHSSALGLRFDAFFSTFLLPVKKFCLHIFLYYSVVVSDPSFLFFVFQAFLPRLKTCLRFV